MKTVKTYVLVVIAIVTVGAVGWHFFLGENEASVSKVLAVNESGEKLQTEKKDEQGNVKSGATLVIPKEYFSALTADEQRELDKWFFESGHGSAKKKQYEAYSKETLIEMAKNGDAQAMIMLAPFAIREKGYDAGQAIYMKAAIQGSTRALAELGLLEDTFHFDSKASMEEKERVAVNVLAWYRVASMRGDQWPEISRVQMFANLSGVATAPLADRIDKLAHMRYESLEKARRESNLEPFDNSVPASVEKYFNHQKALLAL